MAQTVSEIVIGANGKIMIAPVGTVAPVTPVAAYSGTWIDIGFTDENGVNITHSRNMGKVDVWQSFYAARRFVTERDLMASFVLRQWNKTTVPLAFGGGAIVTTAGPPAYYTYTPPSPETLDERAMGIDWTDGSKHYRLIIPRGVVSENVQSKIAGTGAADLPITFAITGQDGSNPWTLITDDPSFV